MLCRKCRRVVDQAEESQFDEQEQIKELINCERCSKEIDARCHTCHWPIYKIDLIYESSLDGSLRDNVWIWIESF